MNNSRRAVEHVRQQGDHEGLPVSKVAERNIYWFLCDPDLSAEGKAALADTLTRAPKDKSCWASATLLAARHIADGGPMPKNLAYWAAHVLIDTVDTPKMVPKPVRTDVSTPRNFSRNVRICTLIVILTQKFGLKATRNDGAKPVSACDAVADGLGLSYTTVLGIFQNAPEYLRRLTQ